MDKLNKADSDDSRTVARLGQFANCGESVITLVHKDSPSVDLASVRTDKLWMMQQEDLSLKPLVTRAVGDVDLEEERRAAQVIWVRGLWKAL